jgi:upstream activation factor subunit UAF30
MAGKGEVEADESEHADGVHQLVQPSDELAALIGKEPMARGEATSRLWDYIKEHKLQSDADGREIEADDKLEAIIGKKKVSMFEMTKLVSDHLKKL